MFVAGIDECGTGALCGPIVTAAVCVNIPVPFEHIKEWWPIPGVTDSKKLSPAKRVWLANNIAAYLVEANGDACIQFYSASIINRRGHAYALRNAMTSAILELDIRPEQLIVDGCNGVAGWGGGQLIVPKADRDYFLVSAASILAKVSRDTHMAELAKEFPVYRWESNMGYGTPEHIAALREHGLSPYHRVKACTTALKKR